MISLAHNHSTLPADTAPSLGTVLHWQEELGCDVLTDGFFYSRDPVWLVLELTSGADPGGLQDYFGAGFSVPAPIIRDHLHSVRNAAVEHWRAAQEQASRPVKVVLAGPLTMAELTRDRGVYPTRAALSEAWATLLLEEVAALAEAGADWIQLDEPVILRRPSEVRFLRSLLEPIWEARGRARLIVSTWGPGAAPLYAQLHSIPADVLALDFVSEPGLLSLLGTVGASQELYIGVARANAEFPVLEDLAPSLVQALKRYHLPVVHFGPACGLGSASPERARAVLEYSARVARTCASVLPGA